MHSYFCMSYPALSLFWSFFPKSNSSFLQTFPTGFRDLELLKASLISKDQSKEDTRHLILFHILHHQVLCTVQQQEYICPIFVFSTEVPAEALLLPFMFPSGLESRRALTFLTLFPHLCSVSIFLPDHMSLLSPVTIGFGAN